MCQVGYLQEVNRDTRPTKHKILQWVCLSMLLLLLSFIFWNCVIILCYLIRVIINYFAFLFAWQVKNFVFPNPSLPVDTWMLLAVPIFFKLITTYMEPLFLAASRVWTMHLCLFAVLQYIYLTARRNICSLNIVCFPEVKAWCLRSTKLHSHYHFTSTWFNT